MAGVDRLDALRAKRLTLGQWMRFMRLAAGKSLRAVAKELEVSHVHLFHLEMNTRTALNGRRIIQWAKAVNVPPEVAIQAHIIGAGRCPQCHGTGKAMPEPDPESVGR